MTKVGHIWAVLVNLFAVLVVFAMFGAANTTFETIMISGLVLIYVTVVSSSALHGLANLEMGKAAVERFLRIARLLNDPDASSYDVILTEEADKHRRITVRFYINAFFTSIIWLVAIWKLLRAVL